MSGMIPPTPSWHESRPLLFKANKLLPDPYSFKQSGFKPTLANLLHKQLTSLRVRLHAGRRCNLQWLPAQPEVGRLH